MNVEDYVEQNFPIKCGGRNKKGSEVLTEPIEVSIKVYKSPNSNDLSSIIDCPYNTGGHGQRCKASHPKGVDKIGEGVICPYSFDIPYALEPITKALD
jgi:hypothetical protein